MDKQTTEKMKTMKLTGMLRAYEALVHSKEMEKMTNDEC